MRLNIKQKGIILVAIPLLFELIFVVVLVYFLECASRETQNLLQANLAIRQSESVSRILSEEVIVMLGVAVTHNRAFNYRLEKLASDYQSESAKLIRMLAAGASEKAKVDSIEAKIANGRKIIDELTAELSSTEPGAGESGNSYFTYLRAVADDIKGELDRLTEEKSRAAEQSARQLKITKDWLMSCIAIGLILNVGVALFLAWQITSVFARRIDLLTNNSLRLARGEDLLPRIPGSDELAQLDKIFHIMASLIAESMKKEKTLLENTVDVVCHVDSNGVFRMVNSACFACWGYTSEELLGRYLAEVLKPEDRDLTVEAIRRAKEDGKTITIQNRLLKKNGSEVFLSWSGSWSASDNGFFAIARDVTREKELDQIKEDFLSMITHDLRTPLTSIQGTFQMLEMGIYGNFSDQAKMQLKRAESAVSRMIKLVNDLLSISKLESLEFALDLAPVLIGDLLTNCCASIETLAKSKNLKIIREFDEFTFYVDSDRISQTVINLLVNAIKFSPQAGEILLRANNKDNMLNVEIIDNGPGVPANKKESIFEKYKQTKSNRAQEKSGTGLGLAICKKIVEQHGGSIGVRPNLEAGVGSVFWFTIPSPSVLPEIEEGL